MNPVVVGIVALVALLLLLVIGMPVGFVLILIGFLGYSYLVGIGAGLAQLGTVPFATTASFTLSVVPLFILMGELMSRSGTTEDLYKFANRWVGHLPGGLAMATIAACAGFSAVCGSSIATAAAMGTVALTEMRKYQYSPELAAGCVAAGGSLGILIPPSLILVLYGLLTEQAIGKLFLAGVFPGLLLSLLFMISIHIRCKRDPSLGPPAPGAHFREKIRAFKGVWVVLVLFLVIMGGIYAGIFTASEAAGVGAFGALFFALARRQLDWRNLYASVLETARKTVMILVIIVGATVFSYFLTVTTIPNALGEFVAGLDMPRYVSLVGILAVCLVLGCLVDGMSMVILTIPIFFPLVSKLGYDPIWFGIIVVIMVEVGVLTPPVGLNVFTIAGTAGDVPMHVIFRGVFPFWLMMLISIAMLMAFPEIATFLPRAASG